MACIQGVESITLMLLSFVQSASGCDIIRACELEKLNVVLVNFKYGGHDFDSNFPPWGEPYLLRFHWSIQKDALQPWISKAVSNPFALVIITCERGETDQRGGKISPRRWTWCYVIAVSAALREPVSITMITILCIPVILELMKEVK